MAKRKAVKTNAMRIVEQAGVVYETFTYTWKDDGLGAPETGAEMNRPDEQIYKTLVALGERSGPIVAVIPSKSNVDLKKLALVSGNKRVDMLHLKDLEKTTGYIRGGCSPMGMKKKFPTYVDESVLSLEQVIVSAGQRGLQMGLLPRDLLALTGGVAVDILMSEP